MKLLNFILLNFLFIGEVHSQSIIEIKNESDTNRIFTRVETEAAYPGGDTAWRNFLIANLNVSVAVNNGAPKGKYIVIMKFIVSKDGSLADVQCENDPGYGMCKECNRVIRVSSKWIPAQVGGKIVNSYHRQPFTFVVE